MTRAEDTIKVVFEQRRPNQIIFIPLIFSYAAKIAQLDLQTFYTNATKLTNSLFDAWRLFKYDAVLTYLDNTLEAEAYGVSVGWTDSGFRVQKHPFTSKDSLTDLDLDAFLSSGRIPLALEVARRLKIMLREQAVLISSITGPLTLSSQLMGEDFLQRLEEGDIEASTLLELSGSTLLRLTKAYCEAGVNIILMIEDGLPLQKGKVTDKLPKVLKPIWNTAHYFDAHTILYSTRMLEADVDFKHLEADSYILNYNSPLIDKMLDSRVSAGIAIPSEILKSARQTASEFIRGNLARFKRSGVFLTTKEEMPDVPPEDLKHFIETLKNA